MDVKNYGFIIREFKKSIELIEKYDLASYHTCLVDLYVYIYKLKPEKKAAYEFYYLLSGIKTLIKVNSERIFGKNTLANKIYTNKAKIVLNEMLDYCKRRIDEYNV